MSVNIYQNETLTPIAGKTVPMPYTPAPQSMIGDAWVSDHAYAVDDYCIDGNVLYKCKTAHTSTASNRPPYASYWDAVSVASLFRMLKGGGCSDLEVFRDLSTFTTYTGSRISDRTPTDITVKYKTSGKKVHLYIDFSSIPSAFASQNKWDMWSILWGSVNDTLPIPIRLFQLNCIDDSGAFCNAYVEQISGVQTKVMILGKPSACDLHDSEKCTIYGTYLIS